MELGDVRVRSIIMAFSAAVMYKIISIPAKGLVPRVRNMALSFGLMGIIFVPELFNPFLFSKKKI